MFKTTQKIHTVEYFQQLFKLSSNLNILKEKFDKKIKENLISKKLFTVVVGPCSADSVEAVTEYLQHLKKLSDSVADKILIVARIFTAKPRTDGDGYLGLAFHDNQSQPVDFNKGIAKCRQLMINCLQIGLPVADELLYPQLSKYFSDLVSYQFLGARSSLDPLHRDWASGIDIAVGVKNAIDGDLLAVAKSVHAVQTSKQFLYDEKQIETTGNKYSHIVLRGFHDGNSFQKNCDKASIDKTVQLCSKFGLANSFVMVDCGHANSCKVAQNQIENALNIVGNSNVNGIILESYLHSGTDSNTYGVSKTDDCLNLEQTQTLILQLHSKLSK